MQAIRQQLQQHQQLTPPPAPPEQQRGSRSRAGGANGSASSRASTGPSDAGAAAYAAAAAPASEDAECKNRPATIYLPSNDPDFNLRDHLLSLGHPLEGLRGQVDVTRCRCYGYLAVPGGKFRPWKRRWFVLDRYRKTLAYYADSSEDKIKGFVSSCDIIDAYKDRSGAGASPGSGGGAGRKKGATGAAATASAGGAVFCVGVVATRRSSSSLSSSSSSSAASSSASLRCLAPSPEAMRVWLDSVFTAAEGYLLLQSPQP